MLVLELKAQTAKEQRQINLILANAKSSTIFRAKPCNEQIEEPSMVTVQNQLETTTFFKSKDSRFLVTQKGNAINCN